MKNKTVVSATTLAVFIVFESWVSTCLGQGNLTPPGPPGQTMKSLAQIEPRIPISALGIDITVPGSYYVTTNLIVPFTSYGISIDTNNVTIDLNGFTLMGIPGSFQAINTSSSSLSNITILNGTIANWGGYAVNTASGMTLDRLNIVANYAGASIGNASVVRDCVFVGNSQSGINVNGAGCVIINNDFRANNSANVAGNATISIQSPHNRIEGNHITASGAAGYGISSNAGSTNNLVIRNSVIGGGANNYSLGTGNIVGPLITNTVSGIVTNSNPWANFSF